MRLLLLIAITAAGGCAQTSWLFGYEANDGSLPPEVRYFHRGGSPVRYITRDAIVLSNRVSVQVLGANPNAEPEGIYPSLTTLNIYRGNSPAQWQTKVPMFGAVRMREVYPGVEALFPSAASLSKRSLVFTLQPGADSKQLRIRVGGTGHQPSYVQGQVWFTGGPSGIPGFFAVSVEATQISSGQRLPLEAALRIDSSEELSVIIGENRNAALSTEVVVKFLDSDDYRPTSPPAVDKDGGRYSVFETPRPTVEKGVQLSDAVAASFGPTGDPIWVTVLGGAATSTAIGNIAAGGGLAVSGRTAAQDFPTPSSPPYTQPLAAFDLFLAFLNRDTGALRTATLGGFDHEVIPSFQLVAIDDDVALGGATRAAGAADFDTGFVLRWRPSENRLTYRQEVQYPVQTLIVGAFGRVHYAATKIDKLSIGTLNAIGAFVAAPAYVNMPPNSPPGAEFGNVNLRASPSGVVWVTFWVWTQQRIEGPPLALARVTPDKGEVSPTRIIAQSGTVDFFDFTPSGAAKLLINYPGRTEATTSDAALAASCSDTAYYLLLTPAGQIHYATYVPRLNFDFAAQGDSPPAPIAGISCFASMAGRKPVPSAVPGQLITVTGGGFGPLVPIYTAPGPDGNYPLEAGGYRVRIEGVDVPVVALGRGLIAVQAPFTLTGSGNAVFLELFEQDKKVGTLPFDLWQGAVSVPSFFDTGDRNNEMNLPALAALNEDGSINSRTNPAKSGSILSLFGSGLGQLTPPLRLGALAPNSPLSTIQVLSSCYRCQLLYLGSAPGLSTSVFQANVQLQPTTPSEVARPFTIGMKVAESYRSLGGLTPTGVVWVK